MPGFNQQSVLAQVCGIARLPLRSSPASTKTPWSPISWDDTGAMNLVEMHMGRGLSLGARLEPAADDQRGEIIALFDEAMRDIDIRIARIERNHRSTNAHLPAWQYLVRRREDLRQLKQEM